MALLQRRIGLLFAVFLGLLALAGARTLWITGIEGGSLASQASAQQVATIPVPAMRGAIVDRTGVELAVSEPGADVSATPYLVEDPAKTASALAPVLGVPEDDLLRTLVEARAKDLGFVYLRRKLPEADADKARMLVQRLALTGIDFTPSHLRNYPQGMLAAQLLGLVGTDGEGLAGVELSAEKVLHGQDGERRQVRDGAGETINVRDPTPAIAGHSVRLTIDAAIQKEAERVLAKVGEKFEPKGATVIVMDPNTGRLLALANWPRVDANWAPSDNATINAARVERSVSLNYEPGSTFKSFTVAAALEDGVVTPNTPFDLPPEIKVADRTIGEAHVRGAITLTTAEILAQSSNVGAVKIGLGLGRKRFDHWVRRFGFGTPTGIELPGEQSGIVRKLSQYSDSSMGNMPIGQGLAVTPLQMASAYAAIANGGTLRKPHLFESVGGRAIEPDRGKRVISQKTSLQLRHMLEGAFAPGGTASAVSIDGYKLAGKTGTANKPDERGEYSETKYIASFFGMVPAIKPQLVIGVVVDEPAGGNIYGGEVAAPAFGDIAQYALQYLRIPPQ